MAKNLTTVVRSESEEVQISRDLPTVMIGERINPKIEFFTAGCPRSQISEKNLRKALGKLGLEVDVESIDDPKVHEMRGVAAFPAVMIDGEIKSQGDFITVDDCEEILSQYV